MSIGNRGRSTLRQPIPNIVLTIDDRCIRRSKTCLRWARVLNQVIRANLAPKQSFNISVQVVEHINAILDLLRRRIVTADDDRPETAFEAYVSITLSEIEIREIAVTWVYLVFRLIDKLKAVRMQVG